MFFSDFRLLHNFTAQYCDKENSCKEETQQHSTSTLYLLKCELCMAHTQYYLETDLSDELMMEENSTLKASFVTL